MMRTTRRPSLPLNSAKLDRLQAVASACTRERQHWLIEFQQPGQIHCIKRTRPLRDAAIKAEYKSPNGLPARLWKLELQEAADMMDRWWQALFEKLRPLVMRNEHLTDAQQHYIFCLMRNYQWLEELLAGKTPNLKVLPDKALQHKAACYLRRLIRRYRPKYPTARLARSFPLDANCYKVFEHHGVQYIKAITLGFRKRVALPLHGNTPILGNIRVVLDGDRVWIHQTAKLKGPKPVEGPLQHDFEAIDYGYTEAFTTSRGERFGQALGEITTDYSNELNDRGQKRNKLRARADRHEVQSRRAFAEAEKLQKQGKPEEAARKAEVGRAHKVKYHHIRHCNLGHVKFDHYVAREQARIECEINRALNALFKQRKLSVLIAENLRHNFSYGRGADWNRQFSNWMKGVLQDRTEFKVKEKGFLLKAVNPAYSSQTCPICDYVRRENRKGDEFHCRSCGFEGDADWVAAVNLLRRMNDPDIKPWTPVGRVKQILDGRSRRRLEISGALAQAKERTVPGKAVDTAPFADLTVEGIENGEDVGLAPMPF